MGSKLFSELTLSTRSGAGVSLRNRAIVAPMCQYSVAKQDGVATDWHLMHYGAYAAGGFGLITVEATGVEPRGRITPFCLGLWNDEQLTAHSQIVNFAHQYGAKMAVQLGHAGGKGATPPWFPGVSPVTLPEKDGGWEVVSAGDKPVSAELATPHQLSTREIAQIVQDFAQAAKRADLAGYDAIQLHAAHGYLIHQFLSPLTNNRTDEYGGSFANRSRFLLEIAQAVAQVWPTNKVLGIRLSATDWVENGWTEAESAELLRILVEDYGFTWLDISSGGLSPLQAIPIGFGYQVPLATQIKQSLANPQVTVSTVGMIQDAVQAETILHTAQADAVSIGRAALANPHWAAKAASELRVPASDLPVPNQLWRARF